MTFEFVTIPGLPDGIRGVLSGSTAINGAGKDVDILLYSPLTSDEEVKKAGYIQDGKDYDDSPFTSYRRGETNLIVFQSHDEYQKYIRATQLCIALREAGGVALSKEQRILVFGFLRGEDWESAVDRAELFRGAGMTIQISYRTEEAHGGTMHVAEARRDGAELCKYKTFESAEQRINVGALYTSHCKRNSLHNLIDALIHTGVL